MGSLLPYFRGARKLPTSALCLIPPPIPPAATFPTRQQQENSQAGIFSIRDSTPARERGTGCRLLCSSSPRTADVSSGNPLLWAVCTPPSPPRRKVERHSLRSETARGGHKCRGALVLLRHGAFWHPRPPQGETPLCFFIVTVVSDLRSAREKCCCSRLRCCSRFSSRTASSYWKTGSGQAPCHGMLRGFGAEARLQ